MTNETLDLIQRHYSVRKYKPEPVSKELIETVIAAGQRTSTSSNLQAYSAVVVQDPDKIKRLREYCGNQAFIQQAPVFIAWCADQGRLDRASERRGYEAVNDYVEDFLVAAVDVTLVMQTAALAAESLGLGICYIGGIRNYPEKVAELLGLPRLAFPVSGMTVGWPAAAPFIRPRLPLRAVLHWDEYDMENEIEDLAEYDRAMIATGIYDGRQVPTPGVEGESEDYGWQEHSARRSAKHLRTDLRAKLEEMGFSLK